MTKKLPRFIQRIIDKIYGKNLSQPNVAEEDFIEDSKAALLTKTTPVTHIILYTVLVLLILLLIWSYFATIEQITIGMGKVIPSSQDKVIQSLDGGIVLEILVQEGEVVKKNQILMRLDDTRYKSEFEAGYARYLVLAAMVARLNAEVQEQDRIEFPADVKKNPAIIGREEKLFQTRKKGLKEELDALQRSYDTAMKQTKMYESLLPKGYVSKLEYLRSLQNAEEYKTKLIEKKNNFHEQANQDLTKYKGDLESLTQQLESLQDKMIRATIRSPVYGIIKKLNVFTVGGVITPGMNIMEIVPLTDSLLVQTHIKPSDIAFVHVGQTATVKLTAYDYSIYGGLPGVVEYVSADTVIDEPGLKDTTTPRLQAESYYIVNVRVKRNYLGSEKHKLYIMPGMVASVHIKTGKKTVLQYLLKPIIKAKEEALRER